MTLISTELVRGRSTLPTLPNRSSMRTGEVNITHLPGRTGTVFIRKRTPKEVRRNLNLLGEAFGQPQRYYTIRRMRTPSVSPDARYMVDAPSHLKAEQVRPDYPTMVTRISEPGRMLVRDARMSEPAFAEIVRPTTSTYVTRYPREYTETTMRHACVSCGEFRSPSYQERHPLAPGDIPNPHTCRKCSTEETSSEDSTESYERSRKGVEHYHLCRRWTASTGDRISEFKSGRPSNLATGRRRYHSPRRSSRDGQPRAIISYDGSRSRRGTSEYSPEGRRVRVVRRIKYVDDRGRPIFRSRSRSRSLSRQHYRRSDSFEQSSSSADDRVRILRVPSRSRSRSVSYGGPLTSVRSRPAFSFGDDYEHVSTSIEEREPRRVERVVEIEDDRASIRPEIRRNTESMIVEPGTTYAASRAGNFDLESHHVERPLEVRSYTERVEDPPSRSVRIVRVSPEFQDSFRRERVHESIETPRVIYESRPPPIITRQVVEPAVHSVTETMFTEPRGAPVTETHIIDRRDRPSPPVTETHIVERKGRSSTPVRERYITERRARSPSHIYEKHVGTRSESRPAVIERDILERRTETSSPMYERHVMETSTPRRHERRRRVRISDRCGSIDSSDEYSPAGTFCF